uniref:Uncharacterized protein n=1 Tax=Spongospora subterranea TaxID=70186 RepID=A0A0H5RFM4_9EUKA|eukprot:CRZ07454.1 hypothetical protein [Spongospora subterranea]
MCLSLWTTYQPLLDWANMFPIPNIWVSECAHFQNKVMNILAEFFHVKRYLTIVAMHFPNGPIERSIQLAQRLFRSLVSEFGISAQWLELLPLVLHTPSSNLSHMAPIMEPESPLDLVTGSSLNLNTRSTPIAAESVHIQVDELYSALREIHKEGSSRRNSVRNQSKRKSKQYQSPNFVDAIVYYGLNTIPK